METRRIAHRNGLIAYEFTAWQDAPLKHGIFTRLGGVSEGSFNSLNVGGTVGDTAQNVKHNMGRIFEALGVDGERACTVWQVHSGDAIVVRGRSARRGWLARADGMVSNVPGLPLTMRFADCTPILFYDPVAGAIGVAHAGWRGTVEKVAANTVTAMTRAFGSNPADILAGIGPCIGPRRYAVRGDVISAVEKAFGGTDGLLLQGEDDLTYFDLWEANRRVLVEVGLATGNIAVARTCTAENTTEFFSHRAENGKTGRFSAVIALTDG
jgi:polyphenol oxidase